MRDATPANSLFVISWVVVGAMCLCNLFVGVLVETFERGQSVADYLHKAGEAPKVTQWRRDGDKWVPVDKSESVRAPGLIPRLPLPTDLQATPAPCAGGQGTRAQSHRP